MNFQNDFHQYQFVKRENFFVFKANQFNKNLSTFEASSIKYIPVQCSKIQFELSYAEIDKEYSINFKLSKIDQLMRKIGYNV